MRVLAAVALHYGKDFFDLSLESIRDSVDEIAIFYTSKPSYGHIGKVKNPDTRDELREIAKKHDAEWFDISGANRENQHRNYYLNYASSLGMQQVLVVDSDEVHDPEKVKEALEEASTKKERHIGIQGSQWITFWKSFNEYVTDGFSPIRIINLFNNNQDQAHINKGFIYHMGYAINDDLMRYKLSCHGHKSEIPGTWFVDKWLNYEKGKTKYLHPATDAYWIETKAFDKTTLPEFMKKHPLYDS